MDKAPGYRLVQDRTVDMNDMQGRWLFMLNIVKFCGTKPMAAEPVAVTRIGLTSSGAKRVIV